MAGNINKRKRKIKQSTKDTFMLRILITKTVKIFRPSSNRKSSIFHHFFTTKTFDRILIRAYSPSLENTYRRVKRNKIITLSDLHIVYRYTYLFSSNTNLIQKLQKYSPFERSRRATKFILLSSSNSFFSSFFSPSFSRERKYPVPWKNREVFGFRNGFTEGVGEEYKWR